MKRPVKRITQCLTKTCMVLGLTFASLMNVAQAQAKIETKNAQELYNRALAATCANCHGTDGRGVENATMPVINHLNSEQLLTQLMAFKSGARGGTIMPQLAKGYSDEQMQTIANFLGKK